MFRMSQSLPITGPGRATAAAALVATILYCVCVVPASGTHIYGHQPSTNVDNLVGTVCQVPFGFLPLTCGDYELLEERSEPVPLFKYGPNVCRNTRVVRRNEREYRYRRYCDWVWDRFYYSWIQRCSLNCAPTNECTDRNQTSDLSRIECCDGYQTRPADKNDHYTYFYQLYYQSVQTIPVGCPRAVGASLFECLIRQNLTEFMNLVIRSSFFDRIISNNSNMTITVFAPTNAAFDAVRDQLVDADPDMIVGNHIVLGTVKESDLVTDRRFTNLAGLKLHATTASFPNTGSLSYYNPQYTMVHFINGARVVNQDACVTVNGTLHIVDRVLMPGNDTIAEILSDTSRYSRFRDALEAAGTLQFLMKMDISRTVFVPPNDVFDAAIPEALFNCLTAYMRVPLQDLVLHHIAGKTDYNTTLALQGFVYTLQLTPVVITTDSAGVISLSRDMSVQVTMPNIPALNGVIHEINGVLMPIGFDFGKCQEFVPTTPPPTTPPLTLPPMTTLPPFVTTPPSGTTEDPMATDSPGGLVDPGDPGDPGSTPGDIGKEVIDEEVTDKEGIDYDANP